MVGPQLERPGEALQGFGDVLESLEDDAPFRPALREFRIDHKRAIDAPEGPFQVVHGPQGLREAQPSAVVFRGQLEGPVEAGRRLVRSVQLQLRLA